MAETSPAAYREDLSQAFFLLERSTYRQALKVKLLKILGEFSVALTKYLVPDRPG